VGYRHELGDSWSTSDGMVDSLEVRDLELNVLGALVLPGFHEGNVELHLLQGLG
jgi:hypothetical protein